jgi:ATP-dependent DNA helicase RecQ
VARDLRRQFRIKAADEIRLPFSRPNLSLSFSKASPQTRNAMLLDRLVTYGAPAVVYVTRQETAESVAAFLSRSGIHARAYHAGLRSMARSGIQHAFMTGETPVVVATIAFGMGIDKGDIRQVIHYNLPKSIEGYVQEIGRAGRDGKPARCEVLACGEDLTTLESFVHADAVRLTTMRALLDRLLRQGRVIDVSLRELSENCDMRLSVVTTVLAYLEADGVLRPKGGHHAEIRLWLVRKPGEILAGRGKSEQALLRRLLDLATIHRSWHVIRISEAVEACKVSEAVVRRAAETLANSGDARLRYSHKRFRYDLVEESRDVRDLAERYAARFAERDEAQLARIGMVAALAAKRGCLVAALARHFGETDTRPCGQCGPCQGQQAFVIKAPAARAIRDDEWEQAMAMSRTAHPALQSSTQLARFLCGMTSPATLRARLTRHDAFAMLADLPYRDVLTMCQAILRE